ncbi:ABC-type multidrug transport system permease subunit [Chryseobacterium sp. H1D6B]|uniref:MauE/DoxX family redox-associated membrane protein n=1 Tax=Chryseobacterium sp. H1D6B TaxID=2940588 RepID=UPI0015CEE19B|nr:MauE/DoxX family redox-associated membrane protein [Chryseobacterium sp. H1D6B]MDH6253389.1 ABC-type multidrug transport system permease subunit [Chryseobacterium sp. H1D6B]
MKYFKKTIPFAVSIFFVILFCYASISKILDFRNFQSQLGQSPGLAGYEIVVAYGIISLQMIAVILLCFRTSRFLGLWITFGILSVFAGYVAFILIYNKNLPCTCIGLFEKINWKGNLILNIGLITIALAGIFIAKKRNQK